MYCRHLKIQRGRSFSALSVNVPKIQHGTRKMTFNSSWDRDNPCLQYSVSRDVCYCFACRHFSLPSTPELAFAFESGFSNWKIALFKDVGFKPLSKLEQHMNAIYAWSEYKRCIERQTLELK